MAYSFLIPSDTVIFNPAERRTLRMIAEVLEAMSLHDKTQLTSTMPGSRFVFGEVELDTVSRAVTVGGKLVRLSPREYELLVALAKAGGNLVTNEQLRQTVWLGTIDSESRAISQCVSELRRKIEPDPSRPQHVQLVRKHGYRLAGKWV